MTLALSRLLDDLDIEIARMTTQTNPPKQSIMIDETDDGLWSFVNVMGARLSDGSFGSKTVFVDEARNRHEGDVLHYDRDGRLIYQLPSAKVTPWRCAMMAALALGYRDIDNRHVGIIGAGAIGVAVANVLARLAEDLQIKKITVKTGQRPLLNVNLMPDLADMTDNYLDLEGCTTLITATNHVGEPLETNIDSMPIEVVAFDQGWLLGPSWRDEYLNYSDMPAQLAKCAVDEFPHDDDLDEVANMAPIQSMSTEVFKLNSPRTACYLYGVATADLVVGRALHEWMIAESASHRDIINHIWSWGGMR